MIMIIMNKYDTKDLGDNNGGEADVKTGTCMSEQNSLGLLGLEVGWILVPLGFLPDLLGDLPGELLEEQGGIRLGDEGAVEEPA